MKNEPLMILTANDIQAVIIKTNELDYSRYLRLSSDEWMMKMHETYVRIYELVPKLEEAYQAFMATQPKMEIL